MKKNQILTSSEEFNQFVQLVNASSEEEINLFIRDRFKVEKGGSLYIDTKGGDKIILVNGELSFFGKSFLSAFERGPSFVSEITFHEFDKSIYRVLLRHIVDEKFKKHFPFRIHFFLQL